MTSRKKHLWIFVLSTIALLFLIFGEPVYGWRLRAWLSPKNIVVSDDAASLAAQNAVLQAQLAELQSISSQLPQNPENDIRAMVYSNYPFGFMNELLVNAGVNTGVTVGKAVTFQGVFIGTISQVFPDSAIVQTVFDPNFKMPVRIGSHGFDGLLVGGAYPKATSIAKDSAVMTGDMVYTAGPGVPYNLPIGTVAATTTSPDSLFQEGTLQFIYDINDLQTVLIER
jgi:rod shape-determining protein MreC